MILIWIILLYSLFLLPAINEVRMTLNKGNEWMKAGADISTAENQV